MTGFSVQPDHLDEYASTLEGLSFAIDAISDYAHTQGCDKSGFTGLLTLLHPGVDLVGSLFDETLQFGNERLAGLTAGVTDIAQRYRDQDDAALRRLRMILRDIDRAAEVPGS